MMAASWVIIRKDSGRALLETFNKKIADQINREKYDVMPIGQYLASLNKK